MRRAAARVVVEVDEAVAASVGPVAQSRRPPVQRASGVAAGVQVGVAVQPHVAQVGGVLVEAGPGARAVRQHEGDVVASQVRHGRCVAERRVSGLEHVSQRPARRRLRDRAVLGQLVVVAGREVGGGPVVPRQQLEERLDQVRVVLQGARQLPQHGAEPVTEEQDAGREEVGERHLDVTQPLQVGDEAAALDRDREAGRRLLDDRAVRPRPLQRVEGPVELDRGHPLGDVSQPQPARQVRRVEVAAPTVVAPAGDADADRAHAPGYPPGGVTCRRAPRDQRPTSPRRPARGAARPSRRAGPGRGAPGRRGGPRRPCRARRSRQPAPRGG